MIGYSKEWNEYAKKLKRLSATAFPEVIAETLNNVASFAHVEQAKTIRSRFTIRNRYTENSLKFWKANPKKDIGKINAVTGTISAYMELQEKGGIRKPKSGSKVPIPTLVARGGSKTQQVKKKYYAGKSGSGFFVGRPRGGSRRVGVYERYARNKKIRMIRDLTKSTTTVRATHWHQDSIKKWAKASVINSEFVRQAKLRLASVK